MKKYLLKVMMNAMIIIHRRPYQKRFNIIYENLTVVFFFLFRIRLSPVIFQRQIYKLNLKNVSNVQINGIHIILVLNTVKKGREKKSTLIHSINNFCLKRYGIKHYTPDPATEKRRRKMLKKYSLPSNWREVPDANLDRCYYWNLETDEVSWLPPSHPRSHITQSAIKLRRTKLKQQIQIRIFFFFLLFFKIKKWKEK